MSKKRTTINAVSIIFPFPMQKTLNIFLPYAICIERKERVITLVTIETIDIQGHSFEAVTVLLPKTTLQTVSNDNGYIMCGALDVGLLNSRLADRKIIAGRAVGVRTIEELLEAPLESVTIEAEAMGIYVGMVGKEALLKML